MEITTQTQIIIIILIIIMAIWELIWKAIALWKSAQNNHLTWFILILIFNTIGILPIIYIYFYSNKQKNTINKKPNKNKQ